MEQHVRQVVPKGAQELVMVFVQTVVGQTVMVTAHQVVRVGARTKQDKQ